MEKTARRSAVVVVNKCDKKIRVRKEDIKRACGTDNIVKISCLNKMGIDKLKAAVYNEIWSGRVPVSGQMLLNNIRHKDAINAYAALQGRQNPEIIAADLKESAGVLGVITGDTYTEELLDIIFSKFCIGK